MRGEYLRVRALVRQLSAATPIPFPAARERIRAPDSHGVYLIYSSRRVVLHVGRTVRGKRGLRQRLNDHLHGSSSFTQRYLDGRGSLLRKAHSFAYVKVANSRRRALVEALAIGCLCPVHLGDGASAA